MVHLKMSSYESLLQLPACQERTKEAGWYR